MIKKLFYPNEEMVRRSNIRAAMDQKEYFVYSDFYEWSIKEKAEFLQFSITELGIRFQVEPSAFLRFENFGKTADWLVGARINIVESCFLAKKEKVALKFRSELSEEMLELTYAELELRVAKYCQTLKHLGYEKGSKCAIYMPMNVESICLYLAMVAIGVEVVLIPDSFSVEELEKRLEMAECKSVFTCYEYVYNAKKFVLAEKVRKLNNCKIVYLGLFEAWEVLENESVFERRLIGVESVSKIEYEYSDCDFPISILFSSGTTKDPKMIPWTHLTPIKSAIDAFYHLDVKKEDVVTWTTGMGWMMAPWLFFSALINQATLAIYEGSYVDEKYGIFLTEAKVSVLGVIPSLVKIWRKTKVLENFDLGIRIFASTGEPSDENDYLYLQSLSKLKAPIIEYCGGTEIGGAYFTNTVVEPSYISAFSTPTLGTELVFLNSDNKQAEVGEVAEVMIVPPAFGLSKVLLNYDHDKEYYDDRESLIEGKKLRTHGDVYKCFEVDGAKFYRCVGRNDDTFNLNGIKVSSIEIEEIARMHEVIEDVAAVCTADGGPEQLVLFYTSSLNFDSEKLLIEVQSLIKNKLNPLYRVSKIVRIESMPRTASNKLMRKELRKLLV